MYLCSEFLEKRIKMTEINEYRRELRDKIVEYAMTEFYKRGIKAVKMDEISQGLHVSKRTVYEIFGDKEEMLLAGIKARKENIRNKLADFARDVSHNVIDIIAYFYKLQIAHNEQVGYLFFEEMHKYPRVIEFLQASHEREHADTIRFFQEGIREGFFRADVNYELHVEVANIALQEIMHNQLYKKYSIQDLFDSYFLVIIRGFCTPQGIKKLDQLF